MKMTVFGATGRIGGHVVQQALAAGHNVTAVVRDAARFEVRHAALEVATVPALTDPDVLRPTLEGSEARSSEAASSSRIRTGTGRTRASVRRPKVRMLSTRSRPRSAARRISSICCAGLVPRSSCGSIISE